MYICQSEVATSVFFCRSLRKMEDMQLQRLRVDIKDFQPKGVQGLQHGCHPWVATGKHLCGAATDFTLRCCASNLQTSTGSSQPSHPTAAWARSQPVAPQAAAVDQHHISSQPTGAQSAKQGSAQNVQSLTSDTQLASAQAAAVDKHHTSPQAAASQTALQTSIAETDRSVQTATHTEQQGRLHQAAAADPITNSDHQWCAGASVETAGSSHASQQQGAGDDHVSATRSETRVQAGSEQGVQGLAVATCCHHRCSWQHYVGKPLFRQLGFSHDEFEVISWMTGGCCISSCHTFSQYQLSTVCTGCCGANWSDIAVNSKTENSTQ